MVNLLQQGDKKAFELVYKEYSSLLYGFIIKQVPDQNKANDILLNVFMESKKRIQEYDPSCMRFFTWLYQLTKTMVEQYTYTPSIAKSMVTQQKALSA